MSSRPAPAQKQIRRRIAVEAARLMAQHGIRDYRHAKTRAAERLGIHDERCLPDNSQIDAALREHQRLFQSQSQPRMLRQLRETAALAMRELARFEPRLVGAVLEGTADEHSAICLHLYTDQADEVRHYLSDHGIAFQLHDRHLRLSRQLDATFPAFVFAVDQANIDLTVLPYDLLRQAPLERIAEKPMRRASLGALDALLAADGADLPTVQT